jgi:hypothetical protein
LSNRGFVDGFLSPALVEVCVVLVLSLWAVDWDFRDDFPELRPFDEPPKKCCTLKARLKVEESANKGGGGKVSFWRDFSPEESLVFFCRRFSSLVDDVTVVGELATFPCFTSVGFSWPLTGKSGIFLLWARLGLLGRGEMNSAFCDDVNVAGNWRGRHSEEDLLERQGLCGTGDGLFDNLLSLSEGVKFGLLVVDESANAEKSASTDASNDFSMKKSLMLARFGDFSLVVWLTTGPALDSSLVDGDLGLVEVLKMVVHFSVNFFESRLGSMTSGGSREAAVFDALSTALPRFGLIWVTFFGTDFAEGWLTSEASLTGMSSWVDGQFVFVVGSIDGSPRKGRLPICCELNLFRFPLVGVHCSHWPFCTAGLVNAEDNSCSSSTELLPPASRS